MKRNISCRQILIIGHKNIQNALFAEFFTGTLGYPCDIVDEYPGGERLDLDGRDTLILIDYSHLAQDGIDAYLDRFSEHSAGLHIAFINMLKDGAHDRLLEWCSVKGIFYDDATQDQLLKGVQEIFEGECWFARHVITRYLRRHRSSQKPPCQSMSVLTIKEQQIIWCMARGDSNKRIADRLSISDRTVKTHVYNIFRKINVNNRVQAVNWVKNCREQFDAEAS